MERSAQYRTILKQVLCRLAENRPSAGQVEAIPLLDEERDHYQLLYLGWDLTGRVFAVVCHMRLRDGKVWIERDGTPDGVATALLEAGIPQEHIVLGFQPDWKRPYTEFAVA
jgi:hypothetical protein